MKEPRPTPRRPPARSLGACGVLALLLGGCASPPPAPVIGPDDLRQVSNLAACYTEGIDALGAGKVDTGTAIWGRCFTEDVRFTLSFGAFSMTCPGNSARCRRR